MLEGDRRHQIASSVHRWETKNAEKLSKERKKEFKFESGDTIKRVYTPLDLDERGFDYVADLGMPGEYPYTRGISPTMYRGALFAVAQYSGYATPEEANRLWKNQIERGAGQVSVAFDLPTQLGYDPDDPRAEGEVGRTGVSLSTLKDWEIAFADIDLGRVGAGFVCNAPAVVSLASHIALAESQGVKVESLKGWQQNDILKEFIARGNYIFPPAPSMRLATDVTTYCAKHLPLYQGQTISLYHIAERGATPVHEAAFALSNLIAYLESAVGRGISVDRIAPGISYLGVWEHTDFFLQIARIRATRKLHARILKERFKCQDPRSMETTWIGGNGGGNLYRQQYLNNVARTAIAAVVGALSGVQVQLNRPYDEAFGIASDEAMATSMRTTQVVAYETGIPDTVDPLAGSYYVESLTSDIEQKVWSEIEAIDKMGGAVKAIEDGYMQRKLTEDAYRWQKAFESGEISRVGVNVFTSNEEERPVKVYRTDPAAEKQRADSVAEVKRKRDNRKASKALDDLKALSRSPATVANNVMPAVIDAVKSLASVGEICNVFRESWGEHRERY